MSFKRARSLTTPGELAECTRPMEETSISNLPVEALAIIVKYLPPDDRRSLALSWTSARLAAVQCSGPVVLPSNLLLYQPERAAYLSAVVSRFKSAVSLKVAGCATLPPLKQLTLDPRGAEPLPGLPYFNPCSMAASQGSASSEPWALTPPPIKSGQGRTLQQILALATGPYCSLLPSLLPLFARLTRLDLSEACPETFLQLRSPLLPAIAASCPQLQQLTITSEVWYAPALLAHHYLSELTLACCCCGRSGCSASGPSSSSSLSPACCGSPRSPLAPHTNPGQLPTQRGLPASFCTTAAPTPHVPTAHLSAAPPCAGSCHFLAAGHAPCCCCFRSQPAAGSSPRAADQAVGPRSSGASGEGEGPRTTAFSLGPPQCTCGGGRRRGHHPHSKPCSCWPRHLRWSWPWGYLCNHWDHYSRHYLSIIQQQELDQEAGGTSHQSATAATAAAAASACSSCAASCSNRRGSTWCIAPAAAAGLLGCGRGCVALPPTQGELLQLQALAEPLSALAACLHLEVLELTGDQPLPPTSAQQLTALTQLRVLRLRVGACAGVPQPWEGRLSQGLNGLRWTQGPSGLNSQLTQEPSFLASSLPHLTQLAQLVLDELPGQALHWPVAMAGSSTLQHLSLRSCPSLQLASLSALTQLEGLTSLELLQCPQMLKSARAALPHQLSRMRRLRSFAVDADLHVRDLQVLSTLSTLTSLTARSFHSCVSDRPDLTLPQLLHLDLDHIRSSCTTHLLQPLWGHLPGVLQPMPLHLLPAAGVAEDHPGYQALQLLLQPGPRPRGSPGLLPEQPQAAAAAAAAAELRGLAPVLQQQQQELGAPQPAGAPGRSGSSPAAGALWADLEVTAAEPGAAAAGAGAVLSAPQGPSRQQQGTGISPTKSVLAAATAAAAAGRLVAAGPSSGSSRTAARLAPATASAVAATSGSSSRFMPALSSSSEGGMGKGGAGVGSTRAAGATNSLTDDAPAAEAGPPRATAYLLLPLQAVQSSAATPLVISTSGAPQAAFLVPVSSSSLLPAHLQLRSTAFLQQYQDRYQQQHQHLQRQEAGAPLLAGSARAMPLLDPYSHQPPPLPAAAAVAATQQPVLYAPHQQQQHWHQQHQNLQYQQQQPHWAVAGPGAVASEEILLLAAAVAASASGLQQAVAGDLLQLQRVLLELLQGYRVGRQQVEVAWRRRTASLGATVAAAAAASQPGEKQEQQEGGQQGVAYQGGSTMEVGTAPPTQGAAVEVESAPVAAAADWGGIGAGAGQLAAEAAAAAVGGLARAANEPAGHLSVLCPGLVKLSVKKVVGGTFHSLRYHPELQELEVGGADEPLDPCCWAWVSTALHLKRMTIKAASGLLSSDPLVALLSLQQLPELVLGEYPGLTNTVLEKVAKLLMGVEKLTLQGCKLITDNGLTNLHQLPKLQQLTLDSCPLITERGLLMLLTSSQSLQRVVLRGCPATSFQRCQQLAHLLRQRLLKRVEIEWE